MEKKVNKKALIISLFLALVSCFLVFNYIRNLERPETEQPKIKLLVAARDIQVGEEIKSADIHVIEISEDSLPAGVINDRKKVEGQYAKEAIIIGEPFRQERLTGLNELSLSFNIPDGMRAVTVFVNEDNIFSSQLRVGDKIDVIGNYEVEDLEGRKIKTSRMILQDVEVLSIGSSRVKVNSTKDSLVSDESKLPKTVTLCVTPTDAEKLAFTSSYASYTFALRGSKDDKKSNTPGTIIEQLVPHLIFK